MTTSALTPEIEARFAGVRRIAEAVLYSGCQLYPYRAQVAGGRPGRLTGLLVPPAWGARSGEHAVQRTECLLEPDPDATLLAELRFLHTRRCTVQRTGPDGVYRDTPSLRLADRLLTGWDEGVEERIQLALKVSELSSDGRELPFGCPGHEETEALYDADEHLVGRIVRRREEVRGVIRVAAADLPGPRPLRRLTAEVGNGSGWTPSHQDADRASALPHSLVATHLMLGLSHGAFLSLADPPEWARSAAAGCDNLNTWPVLAGEAGRCDVMLSAPVTLPDHPAHPHRPGVAPAADRPGPGGCPPSLHSRCARPAPCAPDDRPGERPDERPDDRPGERPDGRPAERPDGHQADLTEPVLP